VLVCCLPTSALAHHEAIYPDGARERFRFGAGVIRKIGR
jgi:hypothetical protein